jgi:hypothetical protein
MATNIIDSRIDGRLGSYQLTIVDRDDEVTPPSAQVEPQSDIVIRWGEQQRSPLKQILKSWAEISFVDPRLELHKIFRGEIDPLQFYVQIEGPGVFWRGNIKSENRGLPFSGRVRTERTNLRVFGGLKKIRNSDVGTNRSGIGIGLALVQGSVFAEDILVRSDVELVDESGNFIDVEQGIETGAEDWPVLNDGDPYEGLVSFSEIVKGLSYKSLSENAIVFDSARLLGSSGTFEKRDGTATTSDVQRDAFIKDVTVNDVVIRNNDEGFEDLDRVGKIIVSLEKEHNLMTEGASIKTQNASDVGINHDVATVQDLFVGTDWTKRDGRWMLINVSPGVIGKASTEIGKITPTSDTKIVVEWKLGNGTESATDPSSVEVEMEYRGDDGSVVSETNGTNNFTLEGPLTSVEINPIIKTTVEAGELQIRARYVDGNGNVIESLTANQNQKGIDDIEINEWDYAFVEDEDFNNVAVNAKKVLIDDLDIINVQPFLIRAAVENKYRPFGVQSVKGELFGLFGPEYCLRITDDDGTVKVFVPTARRVNLTTGTTKFTDVEVPVHTLLSQ